MSAPLNPSSSSSCCAPQCSDAPAFRVPGPAGENAFTFTNANFVMPAVGLTAVVTVLDALWMIPGQTVFIQGAGNMAVASKSGNSVTVSNPGYAGNTTPGITINSGAQVAPGGVGGNSGNAYTNTTGGFVMPAVNGTVQIPVLNTAWMVAGEPIFISNAGSFLVSSIQSAISVTLVNLGYSENVAPATNVPGGQGVTPTGRKGNTGATGLGTLNSISPTTNKGDLIVDNGAASPAANDVRLAAGTDGQILASDSAQPTGLGWKTVTPNTAATDGDIVIFSGTTGKPMAVKDSKLLITATGAIQSTPTGGNARGGGAVDLQVTRTGIAMVASGTNSGILSGESNTASGTDSVVAGGNQNSAIGFHSAICAGFGNLSSGSNSFVGAGNGNTASAPNSTVGGGTLNTATGSGGSTIAGGENNISSGVDSFVGGGNGNQATGQESSIIGGNGNLASAREACVVTGISAVANKWGQVVQNAGIFAAAGDCQESELMWRISTTDATANVEAFLDGISTRATIPINTTWTFDILVTGRSSAGVSACWRVVGGLQNNANTVSLVAAVTTTVLADGTGASWGVAGGVSVTADNVNKSLKIAVTGAVATNIRWGIHARLVEVGF